MRRDEVLVMLETAFISTESKALIPGCTADNQNPPSKSKGLWGTQWTREVTLTWERQEEGKKKKKITAPGN